MQQNEEKPSYSQLLSLLEVVRQMGQVRDLGELLSYIGTHCTRAVNADRCTVFLVDKERKQLWSRYSKGEEEEIRFSMGLGIASECIRTNKSLVIENPYDHPLFNSEIDQKTGYKTRNILCIPLTNVAGEVVGCFQVINKNVGAFEKVDVPILSAFASQAAIAIETALLVEQRDRMIHRLNAINEIEHFVIKENDIAGLAKAAIDKALGPVKFDIAFFGLQTQEDMVDVYFMEKGCQVHKKELSDSILLGNLEESFWQHFEPFFEKKVANRFFVPIKEQGGDPVGFLGLLFFEKREFRVHDKTLVEILASNLSSVYQRQKLLSQKAHSERLATIGKLMSTILHDIRNPIASVYGFCSLLDNDSLSKEEQKKYLGYMEAELDRCNNMTEEFLAFARGESHIERKKINIEDFFTSLSISIENQCKKYDINLKLCLLATGNFMIDPDRLSRVIYNLSNNAIDAMHDSKGTLTLTAKNAQEDANLIEIRVEDTGPGVSEKTASKIFNAFYTKGKDGGTGLGLHISKDIVAAHGGELKLDDTYKEGAAFMFQLPRSL